ncbi:NUDIX hydrolase domain-like protein [Annulohypoxylon maeteangense]|uniref:NUDIX hydrolase domain-like protein n=1 Tax=Annulohypoxylon maeteangense TaxID=1927788 RepID=UPI002007EB07|nr:NUDIX hydrolase domain-like protein [Annulohypoxylon maeteangense]KAI0880788.1 NUDIX hydrolase domain-like protein [Annulohypoxylon maeteangense]
MGELVEAPAGSAPSAPTNFAFSPSSASYNLSMREYLIAHPDFNGIAVGAFVFNPEGKLLLVQRAAHDSMPSLWEIPGGSCDFEDESLLHGVARELWEESGLCANFIGPLIGGREVFFIRETRRMCKFSFLVEVDGYEVKLDPNEHQAFLWVTEEEAQSGVCGDVEFKYTFREQRQSVLKAFQSRKEK